ncbi:helix-turn-helix domain-containing protein [Dyadobacter sp. CY107]|uniref:helix-turn-helix domain-containing protein n=1 Tax=Dyadobacter fanqingshengii TaxID=2906443 RepID=UPI001F23F55A|nr:helix-turn-helix domain-containing protein [Dyadobacter fanqingshengii]MCF2502145.1 helix-turn-helix domain-containing protein [Dyadobacter fanqingshengii]
MISIPNASLESVIKDSFSINMLNGQMHIAKCRLAYHRIIMVQSGSGSISVDEQAYELNSPQLLLVAKGQILTGADLRITGYELSFGDCFWERAPQSANNCKAVLFNNASANQFILLNEMTSAELSPLFEAIYQEHRRVDYINKLDAMAAYLKIIMIKIANINAALLHGYDDYDKQLYRRFVEQVSQHYQGLHDVNYYAALLNVTPRRLSDVCKSSCGKGAKQIINGQLVAEAKRRLQFSTLPVKEIAYQLSFSTPEQFSSFFKKNVSASPTDYRAYFVNIGR